MNGSTTLAKSLKLHQLVFMGLAWMTPMIFFTVYGVAHEAADGMMAAAYLTAFIAIFFTAYSYSRMVKAYPIAGSAYTYTKKAINSKAGFLVGWALLMDYVFSPIIAILTFGIFMNTEFPAVPVFVWIIIMNVLLAVVNIVGIKSAARISGMSVLVQIGFILLFCILIVKDILNGETGAHSLFSITPFFSGDTLDLLYRFQVHALMEAIQARTDIPVLDLTPGIRSLQVHIAAPKMSISSLCAVIESIDRQFPPIVTLDYLFIL